MITTIEGSMILTAPARIAIVAARFNHFIVDHLESGCLDALRRHGVQDSGITIARVPGRARLRPLGWSNRDPGASARQRIACQRQPAPRA